MAYRLTQADFDWNLPNDSMGRGLLVSNFRPLQGCTSAVVLTRHGDWILIDRDGGNWSFGYYKLPHDIAADYVDTARKRVDRIVASSAQNSVVQ